MNWFIALQVDLECKYGSTLTVIAFESKGLHKKNDASADT